MTPADAIEALTYLSQIDPRVKYTKQLAGLWGQRLAPWSIEQVGWCINQYHSSPVYQPSSGEQQPLTLAVLVRMLHGMQETGQAQNSRDAAIERARVESRELESKNWDRTVNSWRSRNRPEWDRLVREGRDKRRDELQRQGIALKPWQRGDTLAGPLSN